MKQYIFLCQTPYHLMVSVSYCRQIQEEPVKKVLVFDNNTVYDIDPEKTCPGFDAYLKIPGGWREKNFFRRQSFKLLYEGYLSRYSYLNQLDNKNITENVFICFNDCNKIYDRIAELAVKKKHEIIMLEEGAGIYAVTPYSSCKASLPSKILNQCILGVKPYSKKYLGDDSRIDRFEVKNPEQFPAEKLRGRQVFVQKPIDDTVFDAYINEMLKNEMDKMQQNKKWIFYIGDCFDDDVHMPEKIEQEHLKKIFDYFQQKNYMVIIKPHPREDKQKYDMFCNERVVNLERQNLGWVPVECIVDKLTPEIVISPCSSALSSFSEKEYCRTIIFVYKLFPRVPNIDSSYFEKLAEKSFKIHVPADFQQLDKFLEEQ